MDPYIRDTIARVAQEEGVNPAFALAVAERESSGNPTARNSKSIFGLFQMTGKLRRLYGSGDSADPETQTRAWTHFIGDTRKQLGNHLGREPTDAETYLGHFWGPARAARVINGTHAGLAPADVFSPDELKVNPTLARGDTAGGLASTIMADLDRRQASYNGYAAPESGAKSIGNGDKSTQKGVDFAQYGRSESADFAQFGQAAEDAKTTPVLDEGAKVPAKPTRPGTEVDLAQFGQPLASDLIQYDFAQFGKPQASPDVLSPQTLPGQDNTSRKNGDAIDYDADEIGRINSPGASPPPQWGT